MKTSALSKAFRELRRAGYLAYQHKSVEAIEKMREKNPGRGTCYFGPNDFVQNGDAWEIHVSFDGGKCNATGRTGDFEQAAAEILAVFKAHGVTAHWPGSMSCIIVTDGF